MKLQFTKKHVLWILSAVFMVVMMNVAFAADTVIVSTGFEPGQSWGGIISSVYGTLTTEDKYSGTQSLKLYGGRGNWGAYLSSFSTQSPEIITIKFWAKSTTPAKLGFHGTYGINSYFSFPASSTWTQYTYQLDTSKANYSQLQILLYGGSSGNTYYDDFLITRP